MKVAIRVDASHEIGTGHLTRCLTLADRLAEKAIHCIFICRSVPDALSKVIAEHGHASLRLPPAAAFDARASVLRYAAWLGADWQEDAEGTFRIISEARVDWLITDHYGIDRRWQSFVRPAVGHIMVIDDIADRTHDCDLLLDQNDLTGGDLRYRSLVPASCQLLLGPRYALLRPEFAAWRQKAAAPREPRLHVCFGGSDPANHTAMAIAALDAIAPNFATDIVVGSAHADKAEIEMACRTRPYLRLHVATPRMAELMAQATLALGAGGVMSWERLCLGLPAIIVAIEQNQAETGANLDRLGLASYLGPGETVTPAMMADAICNLISDAPRLAAMREAALALVDGLGADRVAGILVEMSRQ